jgi:hypothetical protein
VAASARGPADPSLWRDNPFEHEAAGAGEPSPPQTEDGTFILGATLRPAPEELVTFLKQVTRHAPDGELEYLTDLARLQMNELVPHEVVAVFLICAGSAPRYAAGKD